MRWLKELAEDLYLPRLPFWLIAGALVLVPLTWVPLAFIARARTTPSTNTPISIFQGMEDQPRYNTQSVNPIFADSRSMRADVPGTVARGQLIRDAHFDLGYAVDGNGEPVTVETEQGPVLRFYAGYPSSVIVDMKLLQRGRERYNIYCTPCHGLDGSGNGMVNVRALMLQGADPNATTWAQAADFNAVDANTGQLTFGEELYPNGMMFNTITNGRANMPAYGAQVTPGDRWAIIAYLRALQVSQGSLPREPAQETDTEQETDAPPQ